MKYLYIILVVCVFIRNENVFSQKLKCCCNNIVYNINEEELFMIYSDFIHTEREGFKIILLDYYQKDTFNIYRVTESDEIFEIIFKKPDCYVIYDTNIVYVYPLSYYQKKDTTWLNTVFRDTKIVLDYPVASVSWKNDSVTSIEKVMSIDSEYDPVIIEYTVSNGEITEKKYCYSMLFPDLSTPKGVKTFRSSVCR